MRPTHFQSLKIRISPPPSHPHFFFLMNCLNSDIQPEVLLHSMGQLFPTTISFRLGSGHFFSLSLSLLFLFFSLSFSFRIFFLFLSFPLPFYLCQFVILIFDGLTVKLHVRVSRTEKLGLILRRPTNKMNSTIRMRN